MFDNINLSYIFIKHEPLRLWGRVPQQCKHNMSRKSVSLIFLYDCLLRLLETSNDSKSISIYSKLECSVFPMNKEVLIEVLKIGPKNW